MPITLHNPDNVFPPYRNYSHAAEVKGDARILFISGLNGYVICCQLLEKKWKLEIETVAAK